MCFFYSFADGELHLNSIQDDTTSIGHSIILNVIISLIFLKSQCTRFVISVSFKLQHKPFDEFTAIFERLQTAVTVKRLALVAA